MRQFATLALILTFLLTSVNLTRAACTGTVEECQAQIDQQKSQLTTIQQQQDDLQKQLDAASRNLNATTAQLNDLQKKVDDIHSQLVKAEDDLKQAQGILDKNKTLFRARVRDLYVKGSTSGWELIFGDSYSFADAAQFAGLKQAVINRNKDLITQYTSTVKNLDTARTQMADSENKARSQVSQIASLRNGLLSQAASIKSKLAFYAQQQAVIGRTIGSLSSQLTQLAAAFARKQAGGGNSSSPGDGKYRFYGYGTEHGVGMSQWGAFQLARTDHNKTSADILKFYYSGVSVASYSSGFDDYNNKITIQYTNGSTQQMTYADYLAGIGETDPVWKRLDQHGADLMDQVQVIAARAYALSYTGGDPNKPICITQACQVYVGGTGKAVAVSSTRNLVIKKSDGSLASAYYFSTSGPHTDPVGYSPSFTFNYSTRQYNTYDDSGYLLRVNYDDTDSQFNNWSGIAPNDWNFGWRGSDLYSPPTADYTGGSGINSDVMEDILNVSLFPADYLSSLSDSQVATMSSADIRSNLTSRGITPVSGLTSIGLALMGGGSERVKWVTALSNSRTVVDGQITGTRFQYVYNIRSPERDWLYSTWFKVK